MAGLASLNKSLLSKFGERRAPVMILELDGTKGDAPKGDYVAFQYFPETISDTKSVNYQGRDIPGGSLPIYQWISSGERVISFTAIFTSDVDLLSDEQGYMQMKQNGLLRRNVDVRTALLWLRRFMLPSYGKEAGLGTPLTQAPNKLKLRIPNSGIGMQGGAELNGPDSDMVYPDGNTYVLADALTAIMTQCDITYEAFFPSGLPRIATVQLAFAQVAQHGGYVSFPRSGALLDDMVTNGSERLSTYPYNMKVTFK